MTRGDADALFHIVVEADPNLVFIADAGGRIVRVNSRWVEYTGVTIDADIFGSRRSAQHRASRRPGSHVVEMEAFDRDRRAVRDYVPAARGRATATIAGFSRALCRMLENGNTIGWYGVATDVDDQVRNLEASRFLSESATALTSSFDRRRILEAFMRVAKSRFSDGCIITLLDENRQFERTRRSRIAIRRSRHARSRSPGEFRSYRTALRRGSMRRSNRS